MGYCQALFVRRGTLTENTTRIADLLSKAGLPWARSHELFLGHRSQETVQEFVESAARPLMDLGRVPILITGLDVSNVAAVSEIVNSPINVVNGETVLVRLVADSDASVIAAGHLIRRLVAEAEATRSMPKWWPLFQAGRQGAGWGALKADLGELWQYVNVAINPFTDQATIDVVREQVMVAQVFVPALNDIAADGSVRVSDGMTPYGAKAGDTYSIPQLVSEFSDLESWPTCIFLGPTLPDWSDEVNLERVSRAVTSFSTEARALWDSKGLARYAPLWTMAA